MPTSWSDLAGARVGVWGVGVEGRATLRKLAALGLAAAVIVDERPSDDLAALRGDEGQAALAGCDVVIKSPGISRYGEQATSLLAQGVALLGGLGLWLEEADRGRVACITGTKGKSTTTAVAGHLARGLGRSVLVGGNIGVAPWDPEVDQTVDLWVVETSSHQATDVQTGPSVVALTSLGEDHVDWHGGVERYVRDKLGLATRPGVRHVVADGGSATLRARAGLLGDHVEWVPADADTSWAAGLGLLGAHNLHNAEIARRVLVALGVTEAADLERVATATTGFTGLPSRLRLIADHDGVRYVDDSLSTNVLPTLAAVDAFPGCRVALIVGGYDRGIDYAPLAAGLDARADPLVVLTLPENGPRIGALVTRHDVRDCPDLDAAVQAAAGWASVGGGVVLLAPAAPSFGVYRNYAERSADFARAVSRVTT
ncbi:MAG TPA: UDP-N-acetylmuramoyl-L-alanine--D-glutamate ligase [Mycobacteriales bacterium]